MKDSTYCTVTVVNIDEYMSEHADSISGRIHKTSLIVIASGRAQMWETEGRRVMSHCKPLCLYVFLPSVHITFSTNNSQKDHLLSQKSLDILIMT